MPGISSLLNIGQKALNVSQVGIEVTGQNIANVNTVGYSRQRVVIQDDIYLDYAPGQMGTGVRAASIQRQFDEFIEESYNTKSSARSKWNTLYASMTSVETVFNESSTKGVSSALTSFFDDWQNLSLDPKSYPQRQNVLSDAQSLISILRQANDDLISVQNQADQYIGQDVAAVNKLIQEIADINSQLAVHDNPPINNANGFYDERARRVRDLRN
uniref:Flagellar hook-associated protein 1 n=1 Tax=Fundidesulfovibrio putealis TaxID=270496 RepID=A0A7C3W8T8_9BACT